tara:strand:- start:1180 stop:1410 length:231 start_codon:yes stop_codon:yes gene_type:complete
MSFVQKFKDFFFKPDLDDHFIIEKWKKETDEADRLKELHRQSRKQENKPKKSLTVEDFERAKQSKKQKNKTLSSNF